jgi:hypothetical protein
MWNQDPKSDPSNARVRGLILDSNQARSLYPELQRKMPKLDHFFLGSVKSHAMVVLSDSSVVVYVPSEFATADGLPPSLPTDFLTKDELASLPAVEQRESELRTQWLGAHIPKSDYVSFSHVGATRDHAVTQQRNLDLAGQTCKVLYPHKSYHNQRVDTAVIRLQGASDVDSYKEVIGDQLTGAEATLSNLAFESTAPNPTLSQISHHVYGRGGRTSLLHDLRHMTGQLSIDIEADVSRYGTDFQQPHYQGIDLRVKSVASGITAQDVVKGLSGLSADTEVRFTADKPENLHFCETVTAGVKAEQEDAAKAKQRSAA